MAIRKVVQVDDDMSNVLRTKCEEVRKFDSDLVSLLNDMKDTLRAENGVGLAAPQVGVSLRVVVIDAGEGYYEMINPVILSTKGEQTGAEGCLSYKGKQGTVTRPYKVKAEYRDRNGKKHKLTAEGLFARAVCHETDHLDGKLYIDIATDIVDCADDEDEE